MVGTTKHFLIGARIDEKASRGKTDMFGNKRSAPSGDMMDEIAEKKLTGGYNVGRKNLCPTCNIFRSVNGICGC